MTRPLRVGLLVLAGMVLAGVAWWAGTQSPQRPRSTFAVESTFSQVAGLSAEAPVQFQGVPVGRVEALRLPETPGGSVRVVLRLNADVQPLLRANTQVQLRRDGLAGTPVVVLVPGAEPAARWQEGTPLPGLDPPDPTALPDRVQASVERLEQATRTFAQLMEDATGTQGTLGRMVYDPTLYDGLVATTQQTEAALQRLVGQSEALTTLTGEVTQGVHGLVAKARQGEGTLGRLLNDPSLYQQLTRTADTLQTAASRLYALAAGAEQTVHWGTLGAYRFSELMEAARHNWLFRRYYEQRGYQEPALFEIRERALEASYKTLLERQQALSEWEARLRLREAALQDTLATPGNQ
jgi:phospholipid/cholesterol/gamma-HCH transport system substrate-binding protein